MKRARAVFRLPGFASSTVSVFLDAKGKFFTAIPDFRDRHNAPRIKFKGFTMPTGAVKFLSSEHPDTFVVGATWKGGVYTCGKTKEEMPFGVKVVEEFALYKGPSLNYYRVHAPTGVVIVKAPNKDAAKRWASTELGLERPMVDAAPWLDVSLVEDFGPEIPQVWR